MQFGILIAPGDCFGMPTHFRLGFRGQRENVFASNRVFPGPTWRRSHQEIRSARLVVAGKVKIGGK